MRYLLPLLFISLLFSCNYIAERNRIIDAFDSTNRMLDSLDATEVLRNSKLMKDSIKDEKLYTLSENLLADIKNIKDHLIASADTNRDSTGCSTFETDFNNWKSYMVNNFDAGLDSLKIAYDCQIQTSTDPIIAKVAMITFQERVIIRTHNEVNKK